MSNVNNYFEQASSGKDNKLVIGGSFETANRQSLKTIVLNVKIDDISTAGQIYVPCPFAGTIVTIGSVINGAIATADAVLTAKIGGVAVTDGEITIAHSGSAAGDVDGAVPTANNVIEAGQAIEIETNGASTNTVEAVISIVVQLS